MDNPLTLLGGGLLIALLAGLGIWKAKQRRDAAEVDSAFLESRLQPDSFFGASGGQRVDTNDGAATGSSMVYSPSQLRCRRRRRPGRRGGRLSGLRARPAGRGDPQGSHAYPCRSHSRAPSSCWRSTPNGATPRRSRRWPRKRSGCRAATARNGRASASRVRPSIRRIRSTSPEAIRPQRSRRPSLATSPMPVMAAGSMATQKTRHVGLHGRTGVQTDGSRPRPRFLAGRRTDHERDRGSAAEPDRAYRRHQPRRVAAGRLWMSILARRPKSMQAPPDSAADTIAGRGVAARYRAEQTTRVALDSDRNRRISGSRQPSVSAPPARRPADADRDATNAATRHHRPMSTSTQHPPTS